MVGKAGSRVTLRITSALSASSMGLRPISGMVKETSEKAMAEHAEKVIIIYGTNKDLTVEPTETIGAVKVAALGLFGIAPSEQGSFVLRAKVDGHEQQLDEAKTVESYHLHNNEKVTLAAGTPFGSI